MGFQPQVRRARRNSRGVPCHKPELSGVGPGSVAPLTGLGVFGEMPEREKEMTKHRINVRVVAVLVAVLGLALSMTAFAQHPPAPTPAPKAPQAGAAAAAAKPEEAKKSEAPKPGEDKPFDEVVKDMEVMKGLFTFYYKADENKLLMEIMPDQLDRVFLFAATADRQLGERGFYSSQVAGDGPFYFRRVGKNIQLLLKNVNFTAPPGTPQARAMERSFPEAILGSAKIQSKPHPDRRSILIDAADFFVADLPGMAPALSQAYQPTNYRFDKANSALAKPKVFPENVLLEVTLHYVTDNPRTISVTLPDSRSIPTGWKYDISMLKETGYKARLADDRVGHFLNIQQDFTSDHPSSPFRRMVNRWHLEKADPSAKLSPPKEPIVYWLENTIPGEYREAFREGALLYNKAFEAIGFKDAIVVKQMPDDADWDPADIRYNTIRWFAGVDASFAIGPSRTNPYTGQIYDADIGFSEGIIRGARRTAQEFVGPVSFENEFAYLAAPPLTPWARNRRHVECTFADGLAQQVAFGMDLLETRGALAPEAEREFMRQYIVEVTAHEVGHTLGLRHNFRASSLLKPEQLNDTRVTSQMSQAASVMDYNPVVIAAKGEKQGDYVPLTVGPYDHWAIEYAYKPIEGNEAAELARIASRVADSTIPYGTDEDALGTFSPLAIDPMVNQYDQSSDPLAYFRTRVGIINELWGSMESKLVKPGEGYQALRRAVGRGMGEYNRALLVASKFIGGVHHYRDHAGDPNGRPPYTPVAAARQREALEFLRTHAFSEKAFQLSPGVMNKLAIERLPGLSFTEFFTTQRLDYPWHTQVLALQTGVLNRLYHPVLLARVQDNELRFAASEKPFTMADMFRGLDMAIWSELDAPTVRVGSLRRNLQREQLKQMIRLVMRAAPPPPPIPPVGFVIPTPPTPRPPEDATTLARASLLSIQAKTRTALAAGRVTDPTTRAHLEETQARIDAALKAQMQKPLD